MAFDLTLVSPGAAFNVVLSTTPTSFTGTAASTLTALSSSASGTVDNLIPTERLRTIKPTGQGGDYTSLLAWEAGEQADLVALNEIRIGEASGDWSASPDTAGVTISGWNSDATRYIEVRAVGAARHSGRWTATAHRIEVNDLTAFTVSENYVRVRGIQVKLTSASASARIAFNTSGLDAGGSAVLFESCLAWGDVADSSAANTMGFRSSDANATIEWINCVAWNWSNTGGTVGAGFQNAGATITATNCTAYGCRINYGRSTGTFVTRNCGSALHGTAGFSGTITQTTNSIVTPAFVDPANGDFRLSPYDNVWQFAGTNYFAEGVTTDAASNSRGTATGAYDIGASHATQSIRTILPAGGNYTTLPAWEAAQQRDLVANNKLAIAEISGDWTSATPDGAVSVSGFTTDATHYPIIRAIGTARHDGKWNAAAYKMEIPNGANGLTLSDPYAVAEGLQLRITFSSGNTQFGGFYASGANTGFIDCIAVGLVSGDSLGTKSGFRLLADQGNFAINCIAYDFIGATNSSVSGLQGGMMYNCTAYNCQFGLRRITGTVTAKNCLAQACTDGFNGAFSASSTNNCSDIAADAPGTDAKTGTVAFMNAATRDLHLSTADVVAAGAGTNLSTDVTYPFTKDIDGNTRSGVWAIGADQGPRVIFRTSFDGSENPLSESGTWEKIYGDDFRKVSGQVTTVAGSTGVFVRVASPTISANQYAQIKLTSAPSSWSNLLGPAVRLNGGSNGYVLITDGASLEIDSNLSMIAVQPYVVVSGDVLRLEVEGSQLRGYVNGTLVVSVTNTDYASGLPGIGGLGDGQTGDDFEAGDLPPSGATPVTGTAASTLSALTSAASGAEIFEGTGASSFAALTSAATGTGSEQFQGAAASTFTPLTAAATGAQQFTGSGAGTFSALTSSATGVHTLDITGTGAASLSALTSAASGDVVNPVLNYADTILSDSPLAFWRLSETNPVGANSIVDLSGNGYHLTPPGSGVTWNQPGATAENTGKAVLFGGTAGIAAGSTVAAALMNSAAWTVEMWYYAGIANSGTLFAAASDASHRVRIEHYAGAIYTSSNVGGNRSTGGLTGTWHHLVLTSSGVLYIDGVARGGTSNTGLNSTANLVIGALNTGASNYFSGRIAEVAVYQTELSLSRVTAHWQAGIAWTLPAGRTFRWSMENDRPDEFPPGSDDIAQYDQGSNRTTAQAYAGSYSLSVSGAWQSATFDNPSSAHRWIGLDRGTIRLRFRYTGTLGSQFKLFQITGKDRSGIDDTNDGVSCRLFPATITFYGATLNHTLAPDTWHEVICRFRRDQAPYGSITVNGVTATTNSLPSAPTCQAWHHLLIGNDLVNTPTGLWLDEFETYGSWVDTFEAEPITGTAAGTLSALTGAAEGTENFNGTAAATLTPLSSAATGAQTFSGTHARSFAPLTAAATGAQTFAGTHARSFTALTSSATGAQTFAGAGAANFAALTSTAAGTNTPPAGITGTGAATLSALTGAATGNQTGTVNLTATIAGTSSQTLTLTARGRLTGTIAGVTGSTLTLRGRGSLTANAAGAGTLTALLSTAGSLSVLIAGTTSTNFNIKASGRLTATAAGTTTQALTLKANGRLTATAAGTSTSSLSLQPHIRITIASGASSNLSITGKGRLTSTIASAASSTLTVKGVGNLNFLVAGTSTVAGGVSGKGRMTLNAGGSGALAATGYLASDGRSNIIITAGASASLTISARAKLPNFSGSGGSSTVFNLSGRVNGSIQIPGTSTCAGSMKGTGRMLVLIPGSAFVTGNMTGTGRMSAYSEGFSYLTAVFPRTPAALTGYIVCGRLSGVLTLQGLTGDIRESRHMGTLTQVDT